MSSQMQKMSQSTHYKKGNKNIFRNTKQSGSTFQTIGRDDKSANAMTMKGNRYSLDASNEFEVVMFD